MNFQNVFIDGSGRIANASIRDVVRTAFASFAGKRVDVTIALHRDKRSLDQNAYLHAEPFPKLAAKWGESIARTKLICMGAFWGYEPCKVTGMLLPVKPHTSDMTVQECTTFIDWLIPWALEEHGVMVTLPDEWREAA